MHCRATAHRLWNSTDSPAATMDPLQTPLPRHPQTASPSSLHQQVTSLSSSPSSPPAIPPPAVILFNMNRARSDESPAWLDGTEDRCLRDGALCDRWLGRLGCGDRMVFEFHTSPNLPPPLLQCLPDKFQGATAPLVLGCTHDHGGADQRARQVSISRTALGGLQDAYRLAKQGVMEEDIPQFNLNYVM